MPDLPKAVELLRAIKARLEVISTDAPGDRFHTDAGARVIRGPVSIDPKELVLGVFINKETAEQRPGQTRILGDFTIHIEAQVPIPVADADGEVVDLVAADVQTAMELEDQSFGGLAPQGTVYLGRSGDAKDGKQRTGYVRLIYLVGLMRKYGAPHLRQ